MIQNVSQSNNSPSSNTTSTKSPSFEYNSQPDAVILAQQILQNVSAEKGIIIINPSSKELSSETFKQEERDYFDFQPLDGVPWDVIPIPEDYSWLKVWLLKLALGDPQKVQEKYQEVQIGKYQKLMNFIKHEAPTKEENIHLIHLLEHEDLYHYESYWHDLSATSVVNLENEAIRLNRSFKFALRHGLLVGRNEDTILLFYQWLSEELLYGKTRVPVSDLEKQIPEFCKFLLAELDSKITGASCRFLIRTQLAQLYTYMNKNFPEHRRKENTNWTTPGDVKKILQMIRFTKRIMASLNAAIHSYEKLYQIKFTSSNDAEQELNKFLECISLEVGIWEIWKKISLYEIEFQFELKRILRIQIVDKIKFFESEKVLDFLLTHPISFITSKRAKRINYPLVEDLSNLITLIAEEKPLIKVTLLSILNANVTFVIDQPNKEPLFIPMTQFFDRDQIGYFIEYGCEDRKILDLLQWIDNHLEPSINTLKNKNDLQKLIGIALTFILDEVNDGFKNCIEAWISNTFTPHVKELLEIEVKIDSEFIYVFEPADDKVRDGEKEKENGFSLFNYYYLESVLSHSPHEFLKNNAFLISFAKEDIQHKEYIEETLRTISFVTEGHKNIIVKS